MQSAFYDPLADYLPSVAERLDDEDEPPPKYELTSSGGSSSSTSSSPTSPSILTKSNESFKSLDDDLPPSYDGLTSRSSSVSSTPQSSPPSPSTPQNPITSALKQDTKQQKSQVQQKTGSSSPSTSSPSASQSSFRPPPPTEPKPPPPPSRNGPLSLSSNSLLSKSMPHFPLSKTSSSAPSIPPQTSNHTSSHSSSPSPSGSPTAPLPVRSPTAKLTRSPPSAGAHSLSSSSSSASSPPSPSNAHSSASMSSSLPLGLLGQPHLLASKSAQRRTKALTASGSMFSTFSLLPSASAEPTNSLPLPQPVDIPQSIANLPLPPAPVNLPPPPSDGGTVRQLDNTLTLTVQSPDLVLKTRVALDSKISHFITKLQNKFPHAEDSALFIDMEVLDDDKPISYYAEMIKKNKMLVEFKPKAVPRTMTLQINSSQELLEAAKTNNLSALERQLQQAAFINFKDESGFTALSWAVRGGALRCVNRLLQEETIDVNAQDILGWTPLHHAAQLGSEEILLKLLHHPRIKSIANRQGKKPVDLAKDKKIAHLIKHPKK